jgi:Zn-dependent protease with chaperone function
VYNIETVKYFQREEEYSADAHAATLLKKPDDLIELLAIVEQKQIEFLQKISPHISEIQLAYMQTSEKNSSHPSTSKRIERLQRISYQ